MISQDLQSCVNETIEYCLYSYSQNGSQWSNQKITRLRFLRILLDDKYIDWNVLVKVLMSDILFLVWHNRTLRYV